MENAFAFAGLSQIEECRDLLNSCKFFIQMFITFIGRADGNELAPNVSRMRVKDNAENWSVECESASPRKDKQLSQEKNDQVNNDIHYFFID